MAALIAGCMIYFMNKLAMGVGGVMLAPLTIVVLGICMAIVLGAVFGLVHGLLITKGNIEPFIVTLGTLGIFRSFLTYLADGGALTLDSTLADLYGPVYYATVLGMPFPIWIFLLVAVVGAVILNRTAFGRHVQAIGSNEQVSRYAAIRVDFVKLSTYMLLGICVGIATVLYVPDCCGNSKRSPPLSSAAPRSKGAKGASSAPSSARFCCR
jgi:ribose transport system permease protein